MLVRFWGVRGSIPTPGSGTVYYGGNTPCVEVLAGVLSQQMESPYFPIALKKLPGNIVIRELKKMSFNIGPVKVKAELANHPGVCVGYRLESDDGSMAYLPDNEPFQRRHLLQRQ